MSIRQLLDQYGIVPNKGLGQSFLVAPGILVKIVAAAEISPGQHILEIGPGLGMLTRALAETGARITAVELDERMLPLLEDTLSAFSNIDIVPGDILRLDPGKLMSARTAGEPYQVVANLPYGITSAALRHLLESQPAPTRMVVMVQKEVAQRIVAKPGALSLLAISVQFYGQPRIISYVPAGAFHPRPNVDSAILRIDVRHEPRLSPEESRRFFALARAGFAQKRKQLKNTLTAGMGVASSDVEAAAREAAIDPQRRPQTLSLDEWMALLSAFERRELI